MTDLRVKAPPVGLEIRRHASLEEIGPVAWNDLVARAPGASVFQGYPWNATWWSVFADPGETLVLLAAYRDKKLVGIAPLYLTGEDEDPSVPALRLLGHGKSDYLDFIVDEDEPGVASALLADLQSIEQRWIIGRFAELAPTASLRRAIHANRESLLRRAVFLPPTPCPGYRVGPDRAGFIALANKSSLKRHASKLATRGRVTVEHLTERSEMTREIDGFIRQHIDRWSVTPFPSLFHDPRNQHFYEALIAAKGPALRIVFTVLRVDGRAVAYHFGLLSGTTFLWYKPSFEIRLHRWSPGEVLLRELFLYCASQGVTEFDFTRGTESFKHRFANHVDESANVIWFRRASDRRRYLWSGRSIMRRTAEFVASRPGPIGRIVQRARDERRPGTSRLRAVANAAGAESWIGSRKRRENVAICRGTAARPSRAPEVVDLDLLLDLEIGDAKSRARVIQEGFSRLKRKALGLAVRRGRQLGVCVWLERDDPSTDLIVTAIDCGPAWDRDMLIAALAEAGARSMAADVRLLVPLGEGVDDQALRQAGLLIEGRVRRVISRDAARSVPE
jgi:CelD/BcsL family acetyltransferase involved in cellulose biosynthesis